MSLEINWHVYRGQKRYGPYKWQQLLEMAQSGQLQPTDNLWHPQYPNMINANQMEGLSKLFKSGVPASRSMQPQGMAQAHPTLNEIPADMVTTALELPGYHLARSFGIVQAVVVPAVAYGTPLPLAYAGGSGPVTGPGQQAVFDAYTQVLRTAAQLGTNAIIGFHIDLDPTGYLAYGTAVWADQDSQPEAEPPEQ